MRRPSITNAVVRRPLRTGICRRNGPERQSGRSGDGLAKVDRRPSADREDAVAGLGGSDRLADAIGWNLGPTRRGCNRQVPPRTRDEERSRDAGFGARLGQRVESPANDHASRSRAYATNACAARVSARPVARASWTSRAGSSPSTRTSARKASPRQGRPRSRVREMNVAPNPPRTAARADSPRSRVPRAAR